MFIFKQSPENRYSFGKIVGYYVGYRPLNSQDSYVYKTAVISSNFRPEVVLRNLKKQTKYEIVVQAYNSKGGGVLSEPVFVETYFEGGWLLTYMCMLLNVTLSIKLPILSVKRLTVNKNETRLIYWTQK